MTEQAALGVAHRVRNPLYRRFGEAVTGEQHRGAVDNLLIGLLTGLGEA